MGREWVLYRSGGSEPLNVDGESLVAATRRRRSAFGFTIRLVYLAVAAVIGRYCEGESSLANSVETVCMKGASRGLKTRQTTSKRFNGMEWRTN